MRKPNRLIAGLLAFNAVSLVALVASMSGAGMVPQARADQPEVDKTPFNASEQRNRIIAQLETMNKKLADLEKKLSTGISVKVTEMPEVIVKDPTKKK
ncbi:MAG: hypothetical protein AB7G11_10130 [Phycisphaerales bacterium]